jgi:hypothetical protein
MPVTFNPFNPFSYFPGIGSTGSASVFPTQPAVSPRTPIAVKSENSDPGLKLVKGTNSLTIAGTTRGPKTVNHDLAGWTEARGMSFTLDIDKAPTVDVFGHTDFTEKNSRLFNLTTGKGWSAEKCAKMLADKVNAGDDFKAAVKVARDGSATISFTRR